MHRMQLSGRSFAVLTVVVVFAAMFSGQDIRADGKHFPEKAYKKPPAIPSQRAILVYRDGTERLIIESSLEGKGLEFGWVIPLPSKPTEFEKTSAGLINTFSLALQPEIVHDRARELHTPLFLAVFITLACVIIVFIKPPERIGWLVILVVAFGFISMSSPLSRVKKQGVSSADAPAIRVHEIRQVGSYELTVMEADNAHALDAWLGDNGFAGLTQEDEKIVSDYINDSWCFVAAKLRRDGEGFSRPHPLSMTFACDKPIYPMRLTATTGSDVYLELYVLADRQATCDVLALEVSDAYRFLEERKSRYSDLISPSEFAGETYGQNVGHPDAAKFMWNGCFLSKLCGTLKPEQMGEDIILLLKRRPPCQGRYYSYRGARETALIWFLNMWCFLPVALLALRFAKKKELSTRRLFVKKAVAPMLLFSLLVCVVVHAVLPKIDVRTAQAGSSMALKIKQRIIALELTMFADEHDNLADVGTEDIVAALSDYFKSKDVTNVYTGEPIKHEDSPGDYTIIEDERGVVWRTYSAGGYPKDYVLRSSVED
ncbi:MAG: DUF2330 domain-containing protein [Planctomycetota bacterium]